MPHHSNKSDKPYSQPCENNKNAILEKLNEVFNCSKNILEIGSGTGQHAVHFAKYLSHLQWQTSDLPVNHRGIQQWIDESKLLNIQSPITIDLSNLNSANSTIAKVDGVFSANTLHIISVDLVKAFFKLVASVLSSKQALVVYGPFNYDGRYTNESNEGFDLWLKDKDSQSGIRDIEFITEQAKANELSLESDFEMPANNRLLVLRKL